MVPQAKIGKNFWLKESFIEVLKFTSTQGDE